jgi:hypothetical protein
MNRLIVLPPALCLLIVGGCVSREHVPSATDRTVWSTTIEGVAATSIDAARDGAVIVGTDTVSGATDVAERWRAMHLVCEASPRDVGSGAGHAWAISISPAGSQALVCWHVPEAPLEERLRVRRLDLGSAPPEAIEEIVGETTGWASVPHPWAAGPERCLASRSPAGGFVMHEGDLATQLAPLPAQESQPIIAWHSSRDGSVLVLGSSGGVYRVSADTVEPVAELDFEGVVFPPNATAFEETLFVLASGTLTRVNTETGSVERKDAGALRSEVGVENLRTIAAVSENMLLLGTMADDSAWDNEETMRSARSRLYALKFSDMSITPWLEVPALAFEFAIADDMIWLAWSEYPLEGTTIVVRPFPGG